MIAEIMLRTVRELAAAVQGTLCKARKAPETLRSVRGARGRHRTFVQVAVLGVDQRARLDLNPPLHAPDPQL